MERIVNGVERALRAAALLSGVILVATATGVMVNAILRFLFGIGIPGMVEISGPILAISIFLALPYATLSDSHVKVVLMTDLLPGRLNRFFKVIGALSVSVMCAAIGYWMYFLMADAAEIGMTTLSAPIKVAPFMAIGMVGACLAALAGLILAIRKLQ